MKRKGRDLIVVPSAKMPTRLPKTRNELKSFGAVYKKATAFDIVKWHREELADINRKIQALQKSTVKNQGIVHSQLLGRRTQIEKTIEQIFAGVK